MMGLGAIALVAGYLWLIIKVKENQALFTAGIALFFVAFISPIVIAQVEAERQSYAMERKQEKEKEDAVKKLANAYNDANLPFELDIQKSIYESYRSYGSYVLYMRLANGDDVIKADLEETFNWLPDSDLAYTIVLARDEEEVASYSLTDEGKLTSCFDSDSGFCKKLGLLGEREENDEL
ncbi:hypothetical protein [Paenibacillus sp. MMO-58]|uniref:hypothetical protein n=1 Tax=Paenibacillus sp. MMO-58 TaxID=3081290 RepID=UPI003015F1F0